MILLIGLEFQLIQSNSNILIRGLMSKPMACHGPYGSSFSHHHQGHHFLWETSSLSMGGDGGSTFVWIVNDGVSWSMKHPHRHATRLSYT